MRVHRTALTRFLLGAVPVVILAAIALRRGKLALFLSILAVVGILVRGWTPTADVPLSTLKGPFQ